MYSSHNKGLPKILMVAPQPFFENRGTPISVYQRVLALSELGYHVDLLTYFPGRNVQVSGLRIYRIPRIPFIKEIPVGPSFAKLILDVCLFFMAVVLLVKGKYQIIHSHEEAAFFCTPLAGIFRRRHVYDMHSSLPVQMSNSKFGRIPMVGTIFRLLERWTIRTADAVITIGPDLEETVRKIKPEARTILIENLPIQPEASSDCKEPSELIEKLRQDGRMSIVYAGSFENYQGMDLLIDSARLISSACPGVIFLMVGGTRAQIHKLKCKVQKEGLDAYFTFTGSVSVNESLAYLNSAEILISPRTSGMSIPLKIYTYLSCGKAIVATNMEAHSRILTRDFAILTEPTPEAFAEGMMTLLRDPVLRQRLGQRAKSFADEKYNLASYRAKLESIYQIVYPIHYPSKPVENVAR